MKIVLFGKSGMLGSCMHKNLSGKHEVFGFGSNECDITDFAKVSAIFDEFKPEIVINAAAYTKVDDCENNVDLVMDINGNAVGNMAELCKKHGAKLIYFSTDYVFDGEKRTWCEDDMPNPINVYGKSKLLGETLIQKKMKKFYIIRTSWLFGENGNNFVDTMVRLGKKKPEVNVVNDQYGRPTYTKDLAEKLISCFVEGVDIDNGEKISMDYGIYHLTNSEVTNWSDFAKAIFKLLNLDVKVKEITTSELNRPAKRPKYSALKSTKFDFKMRSWKKALEEYLKAYGLQ